MKRAILPALIISPLLVLAGCSPVHITPMDIQLAVERAVHEAHADDGYAVTRCAPIVAFRDLGWEKNDLTTVIVRFGSLDPKETPTNHELLRFKLRRVWNKFHADWILINYPRAFLGSLPCTQVRVEELHRDVAVDAAGPA